MSRVLVTGASRGLGLVAASAFEADGHEVIRFDSKRMDFTNIHPDWIKGVPSVDVILHCAGGGLGLRHNNLTTDEFRRLFMVNLIGASEINRLLIPAMQAKAWGRVVHVCSIASGEAVGSVGYNTVKAALAAYVRSLGREMAPFGVVVTGISPGGFQAPDNAMERLQRNNPDAYTDFVQNRLPRNRMGEAQELIPLLRYLASDDASMMGGCLVPIDAGEGRYY